MLDYGEGVVVWMIKLQLKLDRVPTDKPMQPLSSANTTISKGRKVA